MLLRLSRLSCWLAAGAAAFALVAPGGRTPLLAAIALSAGLLALALLRLAVRAEPAGNSVRAAAEPTPLPGEAPLQLDAAAQAVQRAGMANSFEAALHGVADSLRSELGARSAAVLAVDAVGNGHAEVSDLIAFQPGFKTVPRRVRLDGSPLARVLRGDDHAADLPGSAALVVRLGGRPVAAIELRGIDLAVAPEALAGLLATAQQALARAAAGPAGTAAPGALARRVAACRRRAQLAGANVLLIAAGGADETDPLARALRRVGCRFSLASGMLDGLMARRRRQFDLILIDAQMPETTTAGALERLRVGPGARDNAGSVCDTPAIALSGPGLPGDEERFRELGFDDHLSKPIRHRDLLAMLSKHLRSPETAASTGTGGAAPAEMPASAAPQAPPAAAGAEPVLDPSALARLAELDPSGANHLLERVLKAFQTSVTRLRPQLDAARGSDDRNAIRLVAHTLKSSSASIGALRLSELCAQIETMIRLESTDDLGAPLAAFDTALDQTLHAIEVRIGERA